MPDKPPERPTRPRERRASTPPPGMQVGEERAARGAAPRQTAVGGRAPGEAVPPVTERRAPPAEAAAPVAEERAAVAAPARAARRPRNISDNERIVSMVAGGVLALYGMTRRSWSGVAVAAAGAALVFRGATGHSYVYERIGIDRSDSPAEVTQSVTIQRKPEEVYAFWRKLENLPQFMRHVDSVQQMTSTRSHWVARATKKGMKVEWDSEIVEDRPNELIRWRAMPNGGLQHSGEVRFEPAPGGRGTEVHVYMEYRPPVGVALTAMLYPFSRQMLKEEIRRLKQVLEAGEVPTTEGQPSGRGRDVHVEL